MAKYDFNNSKFFRLFENKDTKFLPTILNDAAMLQVKYGWWKTQVRKAATITPTAADGTASFTVKTRPVEVAPLADMISRNGDTMPLDKEGLSWYSATIPDFAAPAIVETALERAHKKKLYELMGNDNDIVSAWLDTVQEQYNSLNATCSYMTAQLISNGFIKYDAGRGVHAPLQKVPIPEANFIKAGAQVWSDPSCKLLDQMAQIENDFRDATGFGGQMVWKIPYDMFHNYFMTNEQVKKWIADTRTYNEQATTNAMVIPEADVLRYISLYPSLSPIEIVKEKVRNMTQESDTMVHGWNQTHAVLCPAGLIAEMEYTDMLRLQLLEEYGSSLVTSTTATLENGLFHLVNSTINNGQYKEWHTDMFASCIPALTQYMYHVIVDTASANE